MSSPRIEVEIGANVDKLRRAVDGSLVTLQELTKESKELQKALENATDVDSIAQYNRQLKETQAAIQALKNVGTTGLGGLGGAAGAAGEGVDKLTRATSNYNSVGIDFARIIQDAPFGIIGVGNNITQLAQSFGTLQSQSTSTGAALKTAFASIFSSGNLLILGVSALTTAFTILQQKGFFKTKEEADDLTESLKKYRDQLEVIRRTSIEGQANSQKEIQSFQLLRAQAENLNIPLKTRLEAVRDLKDQFPEYLKGLSDEQILTGNVGTAYDTLTKSIIATAKARAFSDQIAKNSLDLLTLEQQGQDNVTKILEKRTQLAKLEALQSNQAASNRGAITGLDLQIFQLRSDIVDLEKSQVSLIENSNTLKTDNLKLEAGITKEIESGAKFTKTQFEELQNVKRTFEQIQAIQTNRPPVSFDPSTPSFAGINAENIQSDIKAINALKQSLEIAGLSFEQFNQAIARGAAEGFDSLGEFIQKLSETQQFINNTFAILEAGVENTIGDLAFSIGDSLASGANVFKSAGAVLLGSLAGILNQLGQLAIGTGIAIESIKVALKTLKGVGAVAAGVALVGLAGFVSSKARSLSGGFSGGGGGSGIGSVGTSGISGGSSFTGTGGQAFNSAQNINLVGQFRVSGTDLVYVIDRTKESQI
jgi:hypothetical protein